MATTSATFTGHLRHPETLPPKPEAPELFVENFPRKLIKLPIWALWKYEPNEKGTGWTKVPYQVNGQKAKNNDPSTWASLEQVISEFKDPFGEYDGVGPMLMGTNYVPMDFDDVLHGGVVEPYALEIISRLHAPYLEITPSGDGLRALVEYDGSLPQINKSVHPKKGEHYGMEIYSGNGEKGHFFTMTGNLFPGSSREIPRVSAQEITQAAFLMSECGDERFKRLWIGQAEPSDLRNDKSGSGADACLVTEVVRKLKTSAAEVVKQHVPLSVLLHRQTDEYRDRTIANAIEFLRNHPKTQNDHEYWMGVLEQAAPQWDDSPEPKLFQFAQKPSELSTNPVEWVIEDMYPLHGLTITCGREGIGKGVNTLLSLSPMICGGTFFGKKVIAVPHVLYVDLENPEAVVRDRLARLGLVESENFRIWGQWRPTPPPTDFADPLYAEYAAKTGGFIFFDSLIDFSNGAEENNAAEMNSVLTKARLLARHCAGVHIQHHSDKYGKSGWRGTTAIPAAVDMALGLRAVDDEAFRLGTNKDVRFSTIKAKMCQPWHVTYEVAWVNGSLGYTIVPEKKIRVIEPPTAPEPKQTKHEKTVDVAQAFITSKLERGQVVTVGNLKTELERLGYPQRQIREIVPIMRARFETQESLHGQNRTVAFIKPREIEAQNEAA